MTVFDPGLTGPAGLVRRASAQALAAALFRRHFYAFTRKVFETLHAGGSDRFVPNWHIEAMCHALDEVRGGRMRRLVITVPPRHLKSITTAVAFPAFVLGHDPGAKFIVASRATGMTWPGSTPRTSGR